MAFHPPRDVPIDFGPFPGRASTVRMDLCGSAVETKAIDRHADHVVLLERIKQPVRDARIRPTEHPHADGVPLAEPGRQSPPFTAVLSHNRIALITVWFDTRTFPRRTGKWGRINTYCLSVTEFITDT